MFDDNVTFENNGYVQFEVPMVDGLEYKPTIVVEPFAWNTSLLLSCIILMRSVGNNVPMPTLPIVLTHTT